MSEIEEKLASMVDEILNQYATGGSANEEPSLTRDECCEFIKKIMTDANEIDAWDEAECETCYREFDKDGGGSVSKSELSEFVKRFAKL